MTRAPELTVHGGVGGTTARLDDLDRAAGLLHRTAERLALGGARLALAAADVDWVAGALVSPGTFGPAAGSLAAATLGPHGLAAVTARAELLAGGVAGAVAAYRAADAAADASVRAVRLELGRVAGLAVLAAGVGLVVSPLTPVLLAGGALAVKATGPQGVPAPVGEVGADLLWRFTANDALVETVVGAAPGVLSPAGSGPPGLWLPGHPPGGSAELAALLALGGAGLTRLTGRGPYLSEPAGPPSVVVRPALNPATAPAGVADLLRRSPSTDEAAPRVHAERIVAPDGKVSWVVSVPGTSQWSPKAGTNPFDLSSDVRAMAGRRTDAAEGVLLTMRRAGVRPGEPVMLVGHSLGGITAASLAADPLLRKEFHVTHVVVSGAPVAQFDVPDDVQVLALEHQQDPTPRLDGADNPDRPNWITVERDLSADPFVEAAHGRRPLIAHHQAVYGSTATALDASTDPSLAHWRAGAAAFLARPGDEVEAFNATVTRP
ncbi:hypothetical protein ACIB24_02595 [Spongisporangium articulatum]|uniref:PGAP1-like protein n=1 Tax=Spongisporangium articulatum TaxID=3362603 RepID=A0ABW8AIF6_9ACTN